MSEGRSELEKAIEVWERRYGEAVQAKREAEVVMPFLRAAVEELDSFHAGATTTAAAAPEPASPTPEPAPAAPQAFDGNFGSAAVVDADEELGDDAPTELPNVFPPRRGIAALMNDDDTDEEAAAV